MNIRPFETHDWPQVWAILQPICRAGETYVFSPEITESQMRLSWVENAQATFVAVDDEGWIQGTYFLKPNMPGLGDHVANCGYAVAAMAQGRGIATSLCQHSLEQARDLGYQAMQFNFVVSTNERAVKLWQHLGFNIVGTVPKAFRHAALGEVDVYVMYQNLEAKDA